MNRLWLTVALTLLAGCKADSAGPPPPPPAGIQVGQAIFTHGKVKAPQAEWTTDTMLANYHSRCPGDIALIKNRPNLLFIWAQNIMPPAGMYQLAFTPDSTRSIVEANNGYIYEYTTPPVPETGTLNITYSTHSRVDGIFDFTGGADSGGVVLMIRVTGAFSAVPNDSLVACSN